VWKHACNSQETKKEGLKIAGGVETDPDVLGMIEDTDDGQ
jgi:hypothetical protein